MTLEEFAVLLEKTGETTHHALYALAVTSELGLGELPGVPMGRYRNEWLPAICHALPAKAERRPGVRCARDCGIQAASHTFRQGSTGA